MANEYGTRANLKTRLGISGTSDDGVLDAVLEAVSRHIDSVCGRHFYGASQTRYYTAESAYLLLVDDLTSITTLKTLTQNSAGTRTYGDTWATTDYDLEPLNATLVSPAQPYTRIRQNPGGNYTFPRDAKGVEIAGTFGFQSGASTSAPPAILEACYLLSERLFKRVREAPFGVVGSADLGQQIVIPKLDPDVRMMLAPYVKLSLGAA